MTIKRPAARRGGFWAVVLSLYFAEWALTYGMSNVEKTSGAWLHARARERCARFGQCGRMPSLDGFDRAVECGTTSRAGHVLASGPHRGLRCPVILEAGGGGQLATCAAPEPSQARSTSITVAAGRHGAAGRSCRLEGRRIMAI